MLTINPLHYGYNFALFENTNQFIFQTRRAPRLKFDVQVTDFSGIFWPNFVTIGLQMDELLMDVQLFTVGSVV